jgi:transposase
MSRARVAVLQVVSQQLSVTAAAAEYGISRRHLHRLLARYREDGLDALEPRSRRPKTTPIAAGERLRARVIQLRLQLTAEGLDAGRSRSPGTCCTWDRACCRRRRSVESCIGPD